MSAITKSSSRLRTRIKWWKLMLRFGCACGSTWRDCARLFYYSGIKDSLAYRRWARYSPQRILQFSMRAGKHGRFKVHARDNGLDVGTFAEFFSTRYVILPPEIPPMEPKVIYDLGANIGAASLYFATYYPHAHFYGFEPLPSNYEVCALNYRNLPGAQAFPWAVGSHSGSATFELNASDPRGGRLKGGPIHGQANERMDVQLFSILDLVKRQNLKPPEFLKIDVEGAELEVLEGIGHQCPSIKRMLVETHGPKLEAACLEWIRTHGFQVVHTHSEGPGYAAIWCDRV